MLFLSFAVLILGVFSLFETFKQTSYTEFSTRSSRMEQILLIQQAKERCKNTPSSTTSGLFYITNGETTGKEATCEEILQNRS